MKISQRGMTVFICLFVAGINLLGVAFAASSSSRAAASLGVTIMVGCSLICQEISRIPSGKEGSG